MNLCKIIENKHFLKFRQLRLSEREIEEIIELLNRPNAIVWFRPYIRVREILPDELLIPILNAGIKYGDVSYPKRWMPDLSRIYTQEKIDEAIFELIEQRTFQEKCRLTSLFYWNKFTKIIKYKNHKPNEELSVKWKWNGGNYIEEYEKANLKDIEQRNNLLKIKRYDFLTKEFKKYDNLVYRYFIALELPSSLNEFPDPLKESAIDVMKIIEQEEFPKWANPLIEAVKGNAGLEKLLFEELNWQRK